MTLDPSIAMSGRMPQVMSANEAAQSAISMSQLANIQKENQYNQAVKESYRKNMTAGPDGKPILNQAGVLSDLAQIDPQKTMALKADFDKQKKEMYTGLIQNIDPVSGAGYKEYRQMVAQTDPDHLQHLPENPDPNIINRLKMVALDPKTQMELANKKEEFGVKRDEIKENRDTRVQKQTDDRVDRLTKQLKEDFDADKGRAGNFGQISGKVQSAERLQTLINAYKGGDLPKAQMEELALGMSNMLAGQAGASRSQVEALVPHTFWGRTQDAGSWLLNEPRGAGQQKFVEKMADTIQREKETATNQLNSIRAARLPAHDTLKKLAPDQYSALLQSYGLDPKNIKNGKFVAPVAVSPEDQTAIDWANKNPTDKRAIQILQLHGAN